MSDLVSINLDGDRQAGIRFEEFPSNLTDALKSEIDALTNTLYGRIEAAMPSKTGALRGKLRARLFTDKGRVTGYIDIAAADQKEIRKAASLEYGSTGKKMQVSSHTMRLDHYWAERLAAPRTVLVEAHQRTPRIAEHKFLRGPLQAMRPEINSRLNAVVGNVVAESDT